MPRGNYCISFVAEKLNEAYDEHNLIILLTFSLRLWVFASFYLMFYNSACKNTCFGTQMMRKCKFRSSSGDNIITVTTFYMLINSSSVIYQIRNVFHLVATTQGSLFISIMRYCFSIWSQSLSWIEKMVLKTLRKLSRAPTWRWSVCNRVLHSLSFVVSHMWRKRVANTI